MLFNSAVFIYLFLPFVLLIYFFLNKLQLLASGKAWLVLASLFFYGYWNIDYIILIIISILCNYGLGKLLIKLNNGIKQYKLLSKPILIKGIIFNLAILFYYKYTDFIIANVNYLFKVEAPALDLLLPLAISFFTFQQIAYLVDCYKSDALEYNFLNYCLFVTFFPQLIAGPIVHHKEMMPQFNNRTNAYVNHANIAKGLFIFAIGLFKKVIIADSFAQWANTGFNSTTALQFWDAWGASLSYTFQLYYDFSGYADMAIGIALMFNIVLPINFNSPYKALTIQDFWHRWHMTLSRWLRDYLYIPLGGNRKGAIRTYINVMLTFILGGLWHGAAWTFIVWGALHGLALCTQRLWTQVGFKLPSIISWLLTFTFISVSWIFFRAEDIPSALHIISGMLGVNGYNTSSILIAPGNTLITSPYIVSYLIIFGFSAFFSRNSMELSLNKIRYTIWGSLMVSAVFFLAILFGIATVDSEFLYFNF